MNDIEIKKMRESLVIKSNDFIRRQKRKLTPAQNHLIAYMVAMIDKEDEDFKMYEIKVDDYCRVCGIDKRYFYTEFKELIADLNKKEYWVETDTEAYWFRWFLKAKYLKKQGKVQLMFDDDLKRYLLQQHERFTKYELFYYLALSGYYSNDLYDLLKSYQYLGKEISIELTELKKIIGADSESYDNFKDFRVNVLEPAIDEINTYTDIVVKYERETYGRKVIGIKFSIQENLLDGVNYAKQCAMDKLDRRNRIEEYKV